MGQQAVTIRILNRREAAEAVATTPAPRGRRAPGSGGKGLSRRGGPRRPAGKTLTSDAPGVSAGEVPESAPEEDSGAAAFVAALASVEPRVAPGDAGPTRAAPGTAPGMRGFGLTGFGSDAALAQGYFVEALALRAVLPRPPGRFVDVGSGGGTPALPLAAAWDSSEWTLVEPRKRAAEFLEIAVAALGMEGRVRVQRARLRNYLSTAEGVSEIGRAGAVTLRAVKLVAPEWRGLAASLAPEAIVVWPTTAPARAKALLPAGLFHETVIPAARGVVWIGRPA